MASTIVFDETQWPLLMVIHPTEPVNKQQTVEYLNQLESYFRRNEKFVAVFDVSVSKPPTAEHRLTVATWIKVHKDLIKPNILGTAYIMPNLVQRLVLTTFLKFMDTTETIGPVEVFNAKEKAMQWAKERLKTAGQAV
jgi:hypothetical protein